MSPNFISITIIVLIVIGFLFHLEASMRLKQFNIKRTTELFTKIEREKELYNSLQSKLEQHQLRETKVFQKFTNLRLEISLLNFSFSEILKGL